MDSYAVINAILGLTMRKYILPILRYCSFYVVTTLVLCLIFWEFGSILVMATRNNEFGRAVHMMLVGYIGCVLSVIIGMLLTLLVVFLRWKNRSDSLE
jgi:hypothetical protein